MIVAILVSLLPAALAQFPAVPTSNRLSTATAAVANLKVRGPWRGRGIVAFHQQNFPGQPTHVAIRFAGLDPGAYALQIHYFGDTGDRCETLSGARWHMLDAFRVRPLAAGSYKRTLKDPEMQVHGETASIIGRAISLLRLGPRRKRRIIACDVIGLADEEVQFHFTQPQVTVRNTIPAFLRRFQ